jgi:hypothetical protein
MALVRTRVIRLSSLMGTMMRGSPCSGVSVRAYSATAASDARIAPTLTVPGERLVYGLGDNRLQESSLIIPTGAKMNSSGVRPYRRRQKIPPAVAGGKS